MKILITGADGFAGSALYRDLLSQGHNIIPMVQRSLGLKDEIKVDFCDRSFKDKISSLPGMDAVIHAGAVVDFTASLSGLFVPNVLASAEIARWAKESKTAMVFFSSIAVYGSKTTKIGGETAEVPDNDYGKSKYLAEKMIEASGAENLILRISGIFGANGPVHLGINRAINKAIAGVSPEMAGDGKIKRNYVYVEDLSQIIMDALRKGVRGKHIVAGPESLPVKNMLEEICAVFLPGKKPIMVEPDRAGTDQVVVSSAELSPGRSFRDALRDIKERLK